METTFVFFMLWFLLWMHNIWCYFYGLGYKNDRVFLFSIEPVSYWDMDIRYSKFSDKDWIWMCKNFSDMDQKLKNQYPLASAITAHVTQGEGSWQLEKMQNNNKCKVLAYKTKER